MMKYPFKIFTLAKIAPLSTLITLLLMGRFAVADETYSTCVDEAKSSMDASVCAGAYYDRLEETLDKTWRAILEHYSDNKSEPLEEGSDWGEEYEKIILDTLYEEQQKWEEYRKSACQIFIAGKEEDGTFIRFFGSMGAYYSFPSCYGRVIEQRIETLRHQLCDFGGDEDVCP